MKPETRDVWVCVGRQRWDDAGGGYGPSLVTLLACGAKAHEACNLDKAKAGCRPMRLKLEDR